MDRHTDLDGYTADFLTFREDQLVQFSPAKELLETQTVLRTNAQAMQTT